MLKHKLIIIQLRVVQNNTSWLIIIIRVIDIDSKDVKAGKIKSPGCHVSPMTC